MFDAETRGRVKGFLRGYRELCERYGLVISSCECCNTPWLVRWETQEPKAHGYPTINDSVDANVLHLFRNAVGDDRTGSL